ncbi:MerR family transcriptional regulator [Promicromonospora aerolata]|uniref:MerR family transcriptional regulator n=1 Tax=Promicromonospora aerolata TaxID=195749 RepID=A0ABW4V5A8_9MICO
MERAFRDRLVAPPAGETMTIGALSRRTGVPVKQLRRYEDLGFIYTVGRSSGNYRLFDEAALWCVEVIETWRSLGLTLAEISDLVGVYLDSPEKNIGPRLADRLGSARDRANARIDELRGLLRRIDAYEAEYRTVLDGKADFRAFDPRLADDA